MGYGVGGIMMAAVIVAIHFGRQGLFEPICLKVAVAGLVTAGLCGRGFAPLYLRSSKRTCAGLGVASAGLTILVGYVVGILIPALSPGENSFDTAATAVKVLVGYGLYVLAIGGLPALILGLMCGIHIHYRARLSPPAI